MTTRACRCFLRLALWIGVPLVLAAGSGCPVQPASSDVSFLGFMASYDPATQAWTNRSGLPAPRSVEGAIRASSGRVYVFGGVTGGGQTDRVDAYDPQSGTWTARHNLPSPRSDAFVVEAGGLIYVAGGLEPDASGTAFRTSRVDAYDPRADVFITASALPEEVASARVVGAAGLVLAVGGVDPATATPTGGIFTLDPATNTWTARPPMPTPRALTNVVSDGSLVYVLGGFDAGGSLVPAAEVYDPVASTWTALAPEPVATYGVRFGAALPSGQVMLLSFSADGLAGNGGVDPDFQSVLRLETATGTWTAAPDLPIMTDRQGVAPALGRLFVVGGHAVTTDLLGNFIDDYAASSTNEVVSYDPVANAWRIEVPSPHATEQPFVFEANHQVYVLGGLDVFIH